MMRGNSVGGGSRSTVLDALKWRYSCLSEPLPPATDGGLDNVRRNLHPLWVFGSREIHPHSPTAATASSFKPMLDLNVTIDPHVIKDKIIAVLSGLCFREPHVLVQFWAPVIIQKCCSLTTLDQPFGLGALDEGLYMYRLKSEQRTFVIEEEHREDLGSPGRVYCQKLPEWSFGIHTLPVGQHVQDLAACYDIHRYINLPVFEHRSGCCVGVLELITSSNCIDYSFEVHEVLRALKEENLRSSIVFQDHSFYVSCVHTQVIIRLCTKNGLATLTEHDKHSSMLLLHQQEPTEQYNENTAATNTVEILMIEATYREEIEKFGFRISDGLLKLEELVATRFQLNLGSFKLKYVDADGDLIWIACDIALTESVGEFRQTDHQTVIRLLVLPVVHHSPNV